MAPQASGPSLNDQVEALERSRRRLMIALVITILLWFVPQILDDLAPAALPHTLRSILVVLGVVGGLLWMGFMLRYNRFQRMVRNRPELRERLDDERIGQLRHQAVYRGWVALLICVAVGVAVAPFVTIPDQALLLTLLLVGVTAPIVFFLWLDRG